MFAEEEISGEDARDQTAAYKQRMAKMDGDKFNVDDIGKKLKAMAAKDKISDEEAWEKMATYKEAREKMALLKKDMAKAIGGKPDIKDFGGKLKGIVGKLQAMVAKGVISGGDAQDKMASYEQRMAKMDGDKLNVDDIGMKLKAKAAKDEKS